jgi:hypothetical protein
MVMVIVLSIVLSSHVQADNFTLVSYTDAENQAAMRQAEIDMIPWNIKQDELRGAENDRLRNKVIAETGAEVIKFYNSL